MRVPCLPALPAAVLLLLAACSTPPLREMHEAQGALNAARAAGAERYAPEEYAAGVTALEQSREAVELGDYRLALSYALDALERAEQAAEQAAARRAALESEAQAALVAAEEALESLQEALDAARTVRVPRARLAAPARTAETAAATVQEARAALAAGKPAAARAAVANLPDALRHAVAEVNAAAAGRRSSRR